MIDKIKELKRQLKAFEKELLFLEEMENVKALEEKSETVYDLIINWWDDYYAFDKSVYPAIEDLSYRIAKWLSKESSTKNLQKDHDSN